MLRAKWIVPIGLSLLLLACSPNQATVDNYKKLDWTMTREQVYNVLGKPTEAKPREGDLSGTTVETWSGANQDLITITFSDGKVAMKSMRSNGIDY